MERYHEQLDDDQLVAALDEHDPDWRQWNTDRRDAAEEYADSTEFQQICKDILISDGDLDEDEEDDY